MIEFDAFLQDVVTYLERNRRCPKHHVEHTGSNTYLLDFYSFQGDLERGKRLIEYLVSKIVSDGNAKVFYPGRLNQMNMSNNIIDTGAAVDTIARFLTKHGEYFTKEEHERFGGAIEGVARTYLMTAAVEKPITNQRLWGITGLASFAAYKETREFDSHIQESIEKAFSDMTVDGYFRYYPDAPKHKAFAGYDGITTFYQSRCTTFIRYALAITGIDSVPYEERLKQSERALLSMYLAEGYKDMRMECKLWYWLTPYEVASHGFDGYALANAKADSEVTGVALHNVLYQVRNHFSDGYLHAAKGPAINFQCPIFWTAHLAWLTRIPDIRTTFNAASELQPFTYQFFGKEVTTSTSPQQRFLLDARWQERNLTVGIYDTGLPEKGNVRWNFSFPKAPPAFLFSLRENMNHTWYALRGGYISEALTRQWRFLCQCVVMLLPRYSVRYGKVTSLSYDRSSDEKVHVLVTVLPATKYGSVLKEETKFTYIL